MLYNKYISYSILQNIIYRSDFMFCPKCGQQVEDGARFCPVCGENLGGSAQVPPQPVVEPVDPMMNETACAESLEPWQHKAIVKIMAIICYFGATVFLPCFLMKKQKYLRPHVNNGIVLLIFSAGASVLACIPYLGWVTAPIVICFLAVMEIMGIVKAAKGQNFTMPIIGGIKIIK